MTDKPATRTPRTTRPRAAAKPKPTTTEAAAPAPVLVFETEPEEVPLSRIPLFSINGEEFTVPDPVPPAMALRFLNAAAELSNPVQAGLYLLKDMLGPEKFARFLSLDKVKEDMTSKVIDECIARAMGGVEGSAKN